MGRYLGLDYGERRIGVAVSDPLMMTAQALPYIANKSKAERLKSFQQLFKEYDIDVVVVGLPKDQQGKDSKKAIDVRRFADWIYDQFEVEIKFQDERFSTVAVQRHLIAADVSRKKRKEVVDSQAAAFILQGVLDSST